MRRSLRLSHNILPDQVEDLLKAWRSVIFDHPHLSAHDALSHGVAPELALLLTAHSNAEESVVYPALAYYGHKSDAMAGFTEQAGTKINLGGLEYLDPMSQEFLDKLERFREAVAHHMYEEESDRFIGLKQEMSVTDEERLTLRFKEEFERYMGSDQSEALAPRPEEPAAVSISSAH